MDKKQRKFEVEMTLRYTVFTDVPLGIEDPELFVAKRLETLHRSKLEEVLFFANLPLDAVSLTETAKEVK